MNRPTCRSQARAKIRRLRFEHLEHRRLLALDSAQIEYDSLGNVERIQDAAGREISLDHDGLGRLKAITTPNPDQFARFEYDANSNLVEMQDSTGYSFYSYDRLNRLEEYVRSEDEVRGNSDDIVVGYGYDLAGNINSLTYPNESQVTREFDETNQLIRVEKDGLETIYTYHDDGRLRTTTLPNGVTTTYAYDAAGRMEDIQHRDGSGRLISQFHYTLDANGNREQMRVSRPNPADPTQTVVGNYNYAYDSRDQLVMASYPDGGVVTYTYDGVGNRLAMTTDPDGDGPATAETLTYYYGAENRLDFIIDDSGNAVELFQYDEGGNLVQRLANDTTTIYEWDYRNLLVAVDDGSTRVEYEYDGLGDRVARIEDGKRRRFVNDPNQAFAQTLQELATSGTVLSEYTYGLGRIAGQFPDETNPLYYLTDAIGSTTDLTTPDGDVVASYNYDAFGELRTDFAAPENENRFLFAGEYADEVTELVYLRARELDYTTGRFLSKDSTGTPDGPNQYVYAINNPTRFTDPSGQAIERFDCLRAEQLSGLRGLCASPIHDDARSARSTATTSNGQRNRGEPSTTEDLSTILLGGLVDVGVSFALEFVPHRKLGIALGALYDAARSPGDDPVSVATTAFVSLAPGFGTALSIARLGQDIHGYFDRNDLEDERDVRHVGAVLNRPDEILPPFPPGGGGSTAFNRGGVLLDKAAQFAGDLSTITGATIDPVTNEVILIGEQIAGVENVRVDDFVVAMRHLYRAAPEPLGVSLDPEGLMFDFGTASSSVASGYLGISESSEYSKSAGYGWSGGSVSSQAFNQSPLIGDANVTRDATFSVDLENGEYTIQIRLGAYGDQVVRDHMQVFLEDQLVDTVTHSNDDPFGWRDYRVIVSDGQLNVRLTDGGGDPSVILSSLQVSRQKVTFFGNIADTHLGAVFFEADRVLKAYAGGEDNITQQPVASNVPGYVSLLDRWTASGTEGQSRFWFVPKNVQLTLSDDGKRFLFDNVDIEVLTANELFENAPADTDAEAFVRWFNDNLDDIAREEYPFPSIPEAGFEFPIQRLREATQAVALAQFLRDYDVPVDFHWIDSYEVPLVDTPTATPTQVNRTIQRSGGSILVNEFSGGVEFRQPNNYAVDNAAIQPIAVDAEGSRPSDERQLTWALQNNDALRSAAIGLTPTQRDGNIVVIETDISFATPGSFELGVTRYYNSFEPVERSFGIGWEATPAGLEFTRPQLENFGLNGARDGIVRFVDRATGDVLLFEAQLTIDWIAGSASLLNPRNGNPRYTAVGNSDGSSLVLGADRSSYTLTRPDNSRFLFDADGRLTQQTDPNNNSITYNYAGDRLLSISDSANQAITFRHDAHGRIDRAVGPRGEQVIYTYDATTGNLRSATRERGNRTFTYAYDEEHRLTSAIGPDGRRRFDVASDVLNRSSEGVDARGNPVAYEYSFDRTRSERTTTVTDSASDLSTTTVFDSLNRPLSMTDSINRTVIYEYKAGSSLQWPTQVAFPGLDRGTVEMRYDVRGNLVEVRDPENDPDGDGTSQRFVLDGANNLKQYFDPAGIETTFDYDIDNNLQRLTRGDEQWNFTYYNNGLLETLEDPRNNVTTFTYDEVGNLTVMRDANNHETTRAYDALGRLREVVDPQTRSTTFDYNDHDKVVGINAPHGTASFEYDLNTLDLTRSTNFRGFQSTYEYNALGDLTRITDVTSGAHVSYDYDRFGNLTLMEDAQGTKIAFMYDALQRLQAIKTDNGSLTLEIQNTAILEGAGAEATLAHISRSGAPTDQPLTVKLATTSNSLGVPPEITIAAGEESATFWIAAVDDGQVEDTIDVHLIASSPAFDAAHGSLLVLDDDDGTIQGTAFEDLNGNAMRDDGEGPLADRTIYLDLDMDAELDAGEPRTATDQDGRYSFTGLANGTYYVRQATPAGWSLTLPGGSDFRHEVAVGGDPAVGTDFANYRIAGWAASFGQGGARPGDRAEAVTVDATGNTYIVASVMIGSSVDEDVDVLVAKYSPTGHLLWQHQIGAEGDDTGEDIAVDTAGNVYVTGQFESSVDFDPGPSEHALVSAGQVDPFVLKLGPGGDFVWAQRFGGAGWDTGYNIAVDSMDNVFLTGRFMGRVDFDPGPGTFQLVDLGDADIYVLKLTSNAQFVWAKAIGGDTDHWETPSALATDAHGNVYVGGRFAGDTVDFDRDHDLIGDTLTQTGTGDGFLAKYGADGQLVWVNQMGGPGGSYETLDGVAVDSQGRVTALGWFQGGTFDPGDGSSEWAARNWFDVFMTQFDAAGDFQWARQLGGLGNDRGRDIAADEAGDLFLSGFFHGTVDFDPSTASAFLNSRGGVGNDDGDGFFAKFDAAGNFEWAQQVGGSGGDTVDGVAVDSFGNLHLAGWFSDEVTVRTGSEQHVLTSNGGSDGFVLKVVPSFGDIRGTVYEDVNGNATQDAGETHLVGRTVFLDLDADGERDQSEPTATTAADGSYAFIGLNHGTYEVRHVPPSGWGLTHPAGPTFGHIVTLAGADATADFASYPIKSWAKSAGQGGDRPDDVARAVAVDASGNTYIVGSLMVNSDSGSNNGDADIFIAKYSPTGHPLWQHELGGAENDRGTDIAVDADGNVFVTGHFESEVDFDPGPDLNTLESAGQVDSFLLKLNTYGNFVWAKQLGDTGWDYGYQVAVDPAGDVLMAGRFMGRVDFDPGPSTYQLSDLGNGDIYVTKLTADGGFVWAKAMGGDTDDWEAPGALATDEQSNVYLGGRFAGDTVDFDREREVSGDTLTQSGSGDGFVAKYDAAGHLNWVHQMGGPGGSYETVDGIAVDSQGRVTALGLFQGVSFDPGDGVSQWADNGWFDVFMTQYDTSGQFQWARQFGGRGNDRGRDIVADEANNLLLAGFFHGTVDFDPSELTNQRVSRGGTGVGDGDGFLTKFDSTGKHLWVHQLGGADGDTIEAVARDHQGNLHLTGWFSGDIAVDTGSSLELLASTGGRDAFALQVEEPRADRSFHVRSVTPTSSGFLAEFTSSVDAANLNLHTATEPSGQGLVLEGPSGSVTGSLSFSPDRQSVTFVKSGSPLVEGDYAIKFSSGVNGFRDVTGRLLDGNGDGSEGDDYSGGFVVERPAGTRIVSIPDFVRGPGQEVNVPANSTLGLPITINDGSQIRRAEIRLSYDPALLDIGTLNVASELPHGATAVLETAVPGDAVLTITSPVNLPEGPVVVANLRASVPPVGGNYLRTNLLRVHSVVLSDGNGNPIPAAADDAIHLVSYFGDVSGNGRINANDAALLANVSVLLDSGFAAMPLVDPGISGDISGNGRINAGDASLVARFVALIDVPQIPPIPNGIVFATGSLLVPRLHPISTPPTNPTLGPPSRLDSEPQSRDAGEFEAVRFLPAQEVDQVMTRLDRVPRADAPRQMVDFESALQELSDFDLEISPQAN